jgi:hypothetical protein
MLEHTKTRGAAVSFRSPRQTRTRSGAIAAIAVVACAVALSATAFYAFGRTVTGAPAPVTVQSPAASNVAGKSKTASKKSKKRGRAASSDPTSASASSAGKRKLTASKSARSTKKSVTVASKSVKRHVAVATHPSLAAYKGLGTWVDLYDTKAWDNPTAAVRDMASHGVKTLYIETSNFHSSDAIMNQVALKTFIHEAHAHNMRIVAWYLPNLKAGSVDLSRITQAIFFKTAGGEKFDSFALDIESTEVGSVTTRNRNLAALSKKIRQRVGKTYPLGAIIPSPVGLNKKQGYWDEFPYASVASIYDVFLPMAYYTYHGHGSSAALSDALGNVRILRSQPGCAKVPIHLIGGISDDSSSSEVSAFVSGVRKAGCFGASLYGWPGTSSAEWKALKAIH